MSYIYSAADIGSNSVRMDVVEAAPGLPPRLLATERDVARLGESVFRTGAVSPEALGLICSILARMSARSHALGSTVRRAVATAALRDATNQQEFIAVASEAWGAPVEVISGEEEARLIQRGVRSRLPHCPGNLLIIDVGGGSTEIICDGRAWSLPLGALRLQMLCLQDDELFQFIREQAAPALEALAGVPVSQVIGTSATARAATTGGTTGGTVTTAHVREFYRSVCSLDLAGRRALEGIGPQRAEVIIPGTAVLLHVLETLRLPGLTYSPAGVRDGIIADLSACGT